MRFEQVLKEVKELTRLQLPRQRVFPAKGIARAESLGWGTVGKFMEQQAMWGEGGWDTG